MPWPRGSANADENASPHLSPVGPRWALGVKRGVDLAGALVGLGVAWPLLAGAALAVRIGLGAPVFYRQVRAGQGGRPIRITKLRTMTNARSADGNLRPDGERLTSLGRFLRERSLDDVMRATTCRVASATKGS